MALVDLVPEQFEDGFRQEVRAENGFAYGVQGADLHVWRDRGPVYVLLEGYPLSAPPVASHVPQPSALLDARFGVVSFTGRGHELDELTAWRDSREARWSATWLHGPGGQGKSRLAAEVAARSKAAGWKVVSVVQGTGQILPPPGSQDLRLNEAAGLLAIVDYADRWPSSHLMWLLSNALFQQPVPTRLLLLGRSVSGWPTVNSELTKYGASARDLPLKPIDGSAGSAGRREMFAAARDCFAPYYRLTSPVPVTSPVPLSDPGLGLTLALHMAALTAVDAYARGLTPPVDITGMSAYLLGRERKHWDLLYQERLEGLDFHTPPRLMARGVFTAIMTGPSTYAAGTELLTKVSVGTEPDTLIADHLICYPGADQSSVLEPLYPDRLAEDFLALTLPGHAVTGYPVDPWAAGAAPRLAARGKDGEPPPYSARMVQFLATSASRWPHVTDSVEAILRADPAIATAGGSAALLAIAEVPGISIAALEALEGQFPPGRHTDLDLGIAAITSRLTRHRLATENAPAARATLHAELARRQYNAGFHQEAISESATVVTILHGLVADNPAEYLPKLAGALDNHGASLMDAGRYGDGLASAETALGLWRRLADEDPGDHQLRLVPSLSNYATKLAAVGRLGEAIAAIEEATTLHRSLGEAIRNSGDQSKLSDYNLLYPVLYSNQARYLAAAGRSQDALEPAESAVQIYRFLGELQPEGFLPELAGALDNLSQRLYERRRAADALASSQEAVSICRQLAAVNPAGHLPGLASALSSFAVYLVETGQPGDALLAAQEATSVHRDLSEAFPMRFLPSLAADLDNLSVMFARAGRTDQTLANCGEACGIYRRLATLAPEVHEALAKSLMNLGNHLTQAGRAEDGLAADRESVTLCRKLAAALPGTGQKDLASSLDGIGNHLMQAGYLEEALAAGDEALSLHRRLAAADPVVHSPALASSLLNVGFRQLSHDQPQAAWPVLREASERYRQLAEADTEPYPFVLAMLLDNLCMRLREGKHASQALAVAEENVRAYQVLTQTQAGSHLDGLAGALDRLGVIRWEVGQLHPALAATDEAVRLYRELARHDPALYHGMLARALNNLGLRWWRLQQLGEATAAIRESISIYRRLAETDPATHLAGYADALTNIGIVQAGTETAEALALGQEAVAAYRRLAAADTATFLPGLAGALSNLAGLHAVRGHPEAAITPAEEAIEINRRLAMQDPDAVLPHLARSLWMRGFVQGRGPEARAAIAEAIDIYALLASRHPEVYAGDLQKARDAFASVAHATDQPSSDRRGRGRRHAR